MLNQVEGYLITGEAYNQTLLISLAMTIN